MKEEDYVRKNGKIMRYNASLGHESGNGENLCTSIGREDGYGRAEIIMES